ncbi:zinc finger (Dof type) family protein [Canna indica]|uniref:Zinc finger (Dof type) family protein n=1 Tax=Canna indica TaxID=4628 RepID=A0AAQ3KFD1_9LILI|nr:zinc finger (Dof type) family protein [Canna indica]
MRSGLTRGLENELWSLPHTSQLMSLLRSSTIGNPNLNLNSSPVLNLNSSRDKEDKPLLGVHTSMSHNAHSINLDPSNQLGLGSSPWRNGSHYSMQPRLEQPQHNDNTFLSDKPNSEMQDLFQKLKSSANYHNEQLQTVMSDVARFDSSYATSSVMNAANSMATSILTPTMEPIPLFVGELGCWNPALAAWPDLPTRYDTMGPKMDLTALQARLGKQRERRL